MKLNLKWLAATAVPIVIVAGAYIYFASGIPNAQLDDVIADWNGAIRKLGIEPVFPPEEDIFVGDVLAVLTNDRLAEAEQSQTGNSSSRSVAARYSASLSSTVKIDHVDMSKVLADFYNLLPVFADSTPRPATDREIWFQVGHDKVYEPSPHKYLQLAAFPAFTIKRSRTATAGLTLPWSGSQHWGRGGEDADELEIAFAETYGVPTTLAVAKLNEYCADVFTRAVCDGDALRQHLTSLTNAPATARLADGGYRYDVELRFVYRAYLTRAINRHRSTNANSEMKYNSPASQTSQGNVETNSQDSSTSSLDRAFQRPIVFGYRAIIYPLDALKKSDGGGSPPTNREEVPK